MEDITTDRIYSSTLDTSGYNIYSFSKDFNKTQLDMLIKLNSNLGTKDKNLKLIVKKVQSNEIKVYLSNYIEKILYSNNFKCYLFTLKIDERIIIVLVEYFDVIGNFN